jgi:hypothetical protein
MASVPTTMASFMAAARADHPKQPGEPDEAYKQRLYLLARPSFDAYMLEVRRRGRGQVLADRARSDALSERRQRREADRKARQAEIDALVLQREGAAARPVQNVTIQQERMSQKQTRLLKAKERFSR